MRNRTLKQALTRRAAGKHGRLLVLSGARQTGKTTLARRAFADYAYLSADDPVLRPELTRLSAADWIHRYPRAVVDEVQKAPTLIESLKAAHDASPDTRYVLLGSSQILLLSKVRESLAGRAALEELWPLTLPEMATQSWDDEVRPSRLIAWLAAGCRSHDILHGLPVADAAYAQHAALFERYLHYGGMPVALDDDLTSDERRAWLGDYQRTYLERDVRDLAVLSDLEPFVLAQQAIALRSGRLVNHSELARAATVAPSTAKRFLRYLELSYQVIVLRPWFRNLDKRLAKMPKIHMVDPGVSRAIVKRSGETSGEEVESAVVAEIHKQLRTAHVAADLFHLRTYDGREVDLLIELPHGFVAVEIKRARQLGAADARALRGLEPLLDKPLLAALVLSNDPGARDLGGGVLALPIAWALGPIPPGAAPGIRSEVTGNSIRR